MMPVAKTFARSPEAEHGEAQGWTGAWRPRPPSSTWPMIQPNGILFSLKLHGAMSKSAKLILDLLSRTL